MNTTSPFLTLVDTESVSPTRDHVAARAQEIWRALGCPPNRDLEIWLEAEAELHAIHRQEYRHPRRLDVP